MGIRFGLESHWLIDRLSYAILVVEGPGVARCYPARIGIAQVEQLLVGRVDSNYYLVGDVVGSHQITGKSYFGINAHGSNGRGSPAQSMHLDLVWSDAICDQLLAQPVVRDGFLDVDGVVGLSLSAHINNCHVLIYSKTNVSDYITTQSCSREVYSLSQFDGDIIYGYVVGNKRCFGMPAKELGTGCGRNEHQVDKGPVGIPHITFIKQSRIDSHSGYGRLCAPVY